MVRLKYGTGRDGLAEGGRAIGQGVAIGPSELPHAVGAEDQGGRSRREVEDMMADYPDMRGDQAGLAREA